MVLVLPTSGTAPNTDSLQQALIQDPHLQKANAAFLARVGDKLVPSACRTACALMGEQALVDFSEAAWHVGSTDATTCLIVVAVCHVTLKAWAAHYNSSSAAQDTSIIDTLPDHMERPDVWLVGSFCEHTGESEATLDSVLRKLQACRLPFRVRLACVADANTDAEGGPRALSLTVGCVAGGTADSVVASPAGFEDRGPELPRRFMHDYLEDHGHARSSGRQGCLRNIVETATGRLCIPGLRCRRLSSRYITRLRADLELPDVEFLLRNSTSPDHEPPNFVQDVKDGHLYVITTIDAKTSQVADAWYEWVWNEEALGVGGWRAVTNPSSCALAT